MLGVVPGACGDGSGRERFIEVVPTSCLPDSCRHHPTGVAGLDNSPSPTLDLDFEHDHVVDRADPFTRTCRLGELIVRFPDQRVIDLIERLIYRGQAKAQVFTLDASSTDIKPRPPVDIKNGVLEYKLPPVSAALFVCGG